LGAGDPTAPAAEAPQAGATTSVADEISEEIIVTASKRAQTLQDTPISVAVTSGEAIERSQVRDLNDLQTLVPSLKVNQLQSSANTNFVIRGFGNGANNAGIEPSVGVFIDGVYRSRSAAQIGDLPSIERVEVLRGPQSTLFGKNASAGIISIVTQEPRFELGGNVEASYGNYDAIYTKGYVTGPITDTIAASIGGNLNKRDGYGRDLNTGSRINDRDRWGVRGQLLFRPGSDFKFRVIADYDKIDEICCIVANLVDGPTGNAVRALGGRVNSNRPFAYEAFNNFDSVNDIENYGLSGQADWSVTDALTLTSISAYRAVRSFTNQDSDFTSADLIGSNRTDTSIDTYTQELRVASDFDGPLNFLLGGFYFRENIDVDTSLTFGRDFRGYANLLSGGAYGSAALEANLRAVNPGLPAGQFGAAGQGRFERYGYRNTALSLFGQLDFEITDRLTLTGGFNYTRDRKRVSTNVSTTDIFSSIDLQGSVTRLTQASVANTVGTTALRLGRPATAAEVAAFAAAQPAIFAQIQSGVSAQVNPILGLRPLQFLPPFLNFPNAVESGRTSDNDLSYTLRVAYEASENLSAYATYATGFKASSFNLSFDSRPFPTDLAAIRTAGLAVNNLTTGSRFAGPEDAEVYEIGLKGQYEGFGFNLAIFEQILKGFQSNVFQGTGFVLGNAEKQSTRGFEVDASLSPSDALNVTLSYTYLDPKYDRFTGGSAFNPATNQVGPADLTGLTPSGISKHNISVGSTYTLDLADDNALVFHVDYALSSAFQVAQGLPFKAEPESLNASVTLALANGLELMAWGRNLTEPQYNATIFPSVAQAGSLSAYPSPPKTYGVTGRFRF
jgi:outer membrane receptor protein involved in Fe transport